MWIFLLSFFILNASAQNCDGTGTLFYETLGCTPVVGSCPQFYSCPEYKTSPIYCNFKGRKYALDESIDESLLAGTCLQQCKCEKPPNSDIAQFICQPEICTDSGLPTIGNCHLSYSLDECCSVGTVCSSVTCNVEGKTFLFGQKYLANETCTECICGNSTCQKKRCTFEINPLQPTNTKKIEDSCAPLYTDGSLCCPIDFVCPSSKDKIQETNKPIPTNILFCRYGNATILQSQMVKTKHDKKTVRCYCDYPPYLTCITEA